MYNFKDKFYVTKEGSFYNLCLYDNNFSLACDSDLDKLLAGVNSLLERYGTYNNLLLRVSKMEYKAINRPSRLNHKIDGVDVDINKIIDEYIKQKENKIISGFKIKKKVFKKLK